MQYFDTHVHLTDLRIWADRERILQRSFESGCIGFLNAGFNLEDWSRQLEIKDLRFKVVKAFGIHPYWVDSQADALLEKEFEILKSMVLECQAIGETGLDFRSKFESSKKLQELYFKKHIDLAIKSKLPLILHSVRANQNCVKILKSYSQNFDGIVHSFSGSSEEALEFQKLGFHISFSGSATYPGANRLHKATKMVSDEKILLETDSPDQVPNGFEEKTNYPWAILHTAKHIAKLRGQSTENLIKKSNQNFMKLFNL